MKINTPDKKTKRPAVKLRGLLKIIRFKSKRLRQASHIETGRIKYAWV